MVVVGILAEVRLLARSADLLKGSLGSSGGSGGLVCEYLLGEDLRG